MALSNVSWKGMKALEVMADTLPDRLAGNKLAAAYRYALKPTKDLMRANLPNRRTGALWHSIDTDIERSININEMFGVVGPRRKRNTWNMSGWHSHLIESGTKPHKITAGPGKMMPIFGKGGVVGYAKSIQHKGSKAYKPFSRAMDSTWMLVGARVSEKVSDIMATEIRAIWREFGHVVTKGQLGKITTFERMGGRDPSAKFKTFGRVPFKG